MKDERGVKTAEEKFEASRGWLMRVKERNLLHPIKEMQGETANSNTEAAKSYPKDLAEIINEDDYTKW